MILRDVTVIDRGQKRTGTVAYDESSGTITGIGDVTEQGSVGREAQSRDGEADADADERVVSLPGYTVLPGLVDAHVHYSLSGERSVEDVVGMSDAELALVEARNARKTLESGVTAVRAMGARDIDIRVRDAIEAGDIPGPRTVANCRSITITGGHGHHLGREITGVDDARRAVREQTKLGADFIKFMTTGGVTTPGSDPDRVAMTREEIAAIVDEAHRQGVHAATHVHGAEGAKVAIEAGVDTVEHGTFLDDESVELFLEHDATLVPTLSAPYYIVRNIETATEESARKTRHVYERHIESFEKAVEAGVRIAGGTDAGTPFNFHGSNASEVEFMAKYGLDPVDAVRSMTEVAADAVGLDGSGTLEPGTHADLLVVEGDVTENLTLLNDPTAVVKGGEVVAGAIPERSTSPTGVRR